MTCNCSRSRFLEEVLRAIRTERLIGGPVGCIHELPPPTAIEAERAIIGALLAGTITMQTIEPLRGADFFTPLHRAVIVALSALEELRRERSIPRIIVALRAQGFASCDREIAEELLQLKVDAPLVVDVQALVGEIMDAARRRQISRALRDVDLDLRSGRCTAGEAADRLREIAGG